MVKGWWAVVEQPSRITLNCCLSATAELGGGGQGICPGA